MKPAHLPLAALALLRRRSFDPVSPNLPFAALRGYASHAPGAPPLQVFNGESKFLQRERAAADPGASRRVDYLRDELAARLCDRLLVILSAPFSYLV